VDAAWLRTHLGEPDLVVADVRWIPGARAEEVRATFEAGHLPGAVLLDVDRDLAGPPGGEGGRHPLPHPDAFAAAMRRAGIDGDGRVVAYDDAGGWIAARLWWMLDVLGHRAAVLDGGAGAWDGDLEVGPGSRRPASSFTAEPWPASAIVGADAVGAAVKGDTAAVVDARAGERYRGEVEPLDPVAGHIPGAVSAPWAGNLDDTTGRFLDADGLARRYRALGVADDAIVYCGSGVSACHDILALRLAGVSRVRLYEGSWSGWVSDPARPVATGESPGAAR
jgi:thiosulfate/3-mercaptopyruvate sulfurtransferase